MPFIVGRQTGRSTRHEEDVMAKFLYLFSGGQMADTPEAQEAQMQEWIAWFGTLGDSVVDMGNAFGASSTVTNGSASDGRAPSGRHDANATPSTRRRRWLTLSCSAVGGSVEVYGSHVTGFCSLRIACLDFPSTVAAATLILAAEWCQGCRCSDRIGRILCHGPARRQHWEARRATHDWQQT
jgi:hypothetical protein